MYENNIPWFGLSFSERAYWAHYCSIAINDNELPDNEKGYYENQIKKINNIEQLS